MAPILAALLLSVATATCLIPPGSAAEAQPQPSGIRTLYLIRHGLYDEDDPRDPDVGRALTPAGEEQARLTGARLAQLPVHVDALSASTMTRARQTAEIIGRALGGMAPRLSRDIRECTPPTDRADVMARQRPGEPDSCRQTLEGAWTRLFRPSPERDSTEVVVCHGNVIRYFAARALGLDPTRWLNMTIANCSLTVVQVRPDGRMRLVCFADAGHLPPALQTYPVWRYDPGPTPKTK